MATTTCTTGFGTTKGGVRGLITAGHCGNAQSIGAAALVFKSEHIGEFGDVQWHTSPNGADDNFYSGPFEANLRDVAAIGNAVVGAVIFRNGKVTGKQDDVVYQLNHCNGAACGLTAMTNDEANGGDSGGPWFAGTTAYGIHQGYKWWNFGSRDLFTPASDAQLALGLLIATS